MRLLKVDILAVLFGLGTWLCVNGLWVELPLLVQTLPEAWNLPSYLSVVVQLSNIGPLLYTFLNAFWPKYVTETRAVYVIMGIGLLTTILLGLFWKETSYIGGTEHSTALLVLVFFLAAVDCSSRVTYLPFMARFNEAYLTSYFIGEGLSGFFPSIIALAQGIGGNPECQNNTFGNETIAHNPSPRFEVDVFFYMLFVFTLISLVAFVCLNRDSIVSEAYVAVPKTQEENPSSSSPSGSYSSKDQSIFEPPKTPDGGDSNTPPVLPRLGLLEDTASENSLLLGMSKNLFIYLLAILFIICIFSNGIFPSIQSYSCLPYGNRAYHLSVTLSNMANPTVCFLAFFIPPPTKYSISLSAILAFLLSGWVMTTAVLSPEPPMIGKAAGEVILIASWIILVALFTYVRVSAATLLRIRGQAGLFWCGMVTQCGSALGAIIAFVVVNYTNVFEAYYPCN